MTTATASPTTRFASDIAALRYALDEGKRVEARDIALHLLRDATTWLTTSPDAGYATDEAFVCACAGIYVALCQGNRA